MCNFKTSNLQIYAFISALLPFLPTSMLKIPQLQSDSDRLKLPGTLLSAVNANHRGFDFFF